MGGHVVVMVDRLISPKALRSAPAEETSHLGGDEIPLLNSSECRICQEEDGLSNLETPCGCRGSLKYAHRKCVQQWCNEKGDITCEICHQPYQPDYSAPPLPLQSNDAIIDISRGWEISMPPLGYHNPHLLLDAEHHLYEAEFEDYAATINNNGAFLCRMAALILMSLIIMRHVLNMMDPDGAEDTSAILSLFFLRAIAFLLPCYIVAWALSILQDRRHSQVLQAAETIPVSLTSLVLSPSSQDGRNLQFTVASSTSHQLPL